MHKILENELHETIPVTQIMVDEELWALKLLNILFGLRELQLQGKTVRRNQFITYDRESFKYLGTSKVTS